MPSKSLPRISRLCAAALLLISSMAASEQPGRVTFGGLPVPGATITATQGTQKIGAISDAQGWYSFPDLADGTWTIRIEMLCFATIQQDVIVAPGAPPSEWKLTLPPFTGPVTAIAAPAAPEQKKAPAEPAADDGFLINGSINNGADSPFSQSQAFGNNRRGRRGLYTGGLGFTLGNSIFDAKPYSLTGQQSPKPSYNRMQGLLSFGGPLRIPHLLPNGPNFIVNYQWMRDRDVNTQAGRMPTAAERNGDLGNGVVIPASRISPQAQSLLRFYPLPNFSGGGSGYNYQLPIQEGTHRDALQSRFTKTVSRRDQLFGSFNLESVRTDQPNLFGFLDTGSRLGINTGVTWSHRFTHQLFMNFGYRFSRLASRSVPYFANRENVSGEAGITGNNQDPVNWGPPGLSFASGIAPLSDGKSARNRNQTSAISPAILWSRGRHNVSFGGDFRRQQFNYLSQQDPRGTFTFNGASTGPSIGSDFGGFLQGIPDTSSIAFGNADKYFRESVYDAYITDDWRIGPELSLNIGMRWEYGAPITEIYGRLVNLDIAPGFAAVAPVVASDPVGALTGAEYPASLIHPSKNGFEPRVGIAWRPISGSSMVVRAGYGIYRNTSVYQTIAEQMAQQSPLSKSQRVENSTANPLTLANGFPVSAGAIPNTFAIDPNFRVGYAQNWQLSVQRDLPASLQMTATYLGIKGTRGAQQFLPNTYPAGAVNPCSFCPNGFDYLTSNANSTREAAQLQLRRRLHNGLAAALEYTYSKSIDNAAALGGGSQTSVQTDSNAGGPGGAATTGPSPAAVASPMNLLTAQNWLNLRAERGLSSFDQRYLLSLLAQYTTGMGLHGGTLAGGWRGRLLKEWTFATQISAGNGLPQTPIYPVIVQGTGVTGPVRPDYTGAPLYTAPAGYFLNPAAYVAPATGQWGNAGRSSITGPTQFTLNISMGRTFRLSDKFNLDLRADAANALNHVAYTSWITTVTSSQFGLPAAANTMRTVQITMRVRF